MSFNGGSFQRDQRRVITRKPNVPNRDFLPAREYERSTVKQWTIFCLYGLLCSLFLPLTHFSLPKQAADRYFSSYIPEVSVP